MKKYLVSISLFLVLSNYGFAQISRHYLIDSVEQDSLESGWLELISETPVQKIWIDSLEILINQNMLFEIETGHHQLQVRAQNPANWFFQDILEEIDIVSNDTVQIKLFFPEFKMINSEPYGADVWAGSRLLGTTPYLIDKMVLTENQITLSKFGFKDTTLTNVDQFFPTIWVTMNKDQKTQNEASKLIQINLGQKKKFRNYALLTFGLGLASGAAAYLTKKEADKNYDNYLVASNPTEFNKLFNSTERYDRVAAASYIVFEVNILASAYFFFRYLLK